MTTRKPMPTRKQTAADKQTAATKGPAAGVNKEPGKGPMSNGPIEDRGRNGQELVDDTVDLVKRSSTGEDEPMGEEQPQAPFALVGLSYFIVLALFGLILGWLYFIVL